MYSKKIACLIGIFCQVFASVFAQETENKRPNIFFFFADDWGQYASVYKSFSPNSTFTTPALDKFAKEGVRFNNAHVNSPSCTPCRSALFSGQHFYRTGSAANLMSEWNVDIPTYPLLLEEAGYHIGFTYKAWGPGKPLDAPYGGAEKAYMSAGQSFNNFSQNVTQMAQKGKTIEEAKEILYKEGLENFRSFMAEKKDGQPFCYLFGPTNTHRKWTKGSGKEIWGLNPDNLKGEMPEFLPDVDEVREDMNDYLGEVLALDEMLKRLLIELDAIGERENTLIVVSGDHGIPGFPRAKCNLYPLGTNVSLFVQWPEVVSGGRVVDDFVDLIDIAPTFLEAAGEPVLECMTGKSILPLLKSEQNGIIDKKRDHVITGRERHVPDARQGNLPYPQRAIQTKDFLYIKNFAPDREPMGFPYTSAKEPSIEELTENTFIVYGDFDASPTKAWMFKHRNENAWEMHWRLGFEKRPEEELYDLRKDPDYLENVADNPEYAQIKKKLSKRLMKTLKSTEDPRVTGDGKTFDRAPFISPRIF
jgi:N-sulfoglucosamine sulfohydrolase